MRFLRFVVVPAFLFLLTAGVLEITLRFTENPHRFLSPDCVEVGGAYHHRYQPNCRTSTIYHGARVTYAYNELGLRDRPLASLDPKIPRVLVMGDSNAEGWGIDEEFSVPRRLEKAFGGKVAFVNASMRFAGPVLHALRLRELLPKYRPAAVLWLLTEKDYGYDRFADSLAVERDARGFPVKFSSEDVSDSALLLKRLEGFLPAKSYLVEYLMQGITIRRIRELQDRPRAARFDPCEGVNELLRLAGEARLPVLPVLMPIGPNYVFEKDLAHFPETWACVKSASKLAPIDTRRPELQREELMLPHDSHFNPQGTAELTRFLEPALREFLTRAHAI